MTLTTRSGVSGATGKPFSAADVAFTFNLIAKNPALAQTAPRRRPAPPPPGRTRWCSTSPNRRPDLYLIGTQAIVSQHVWQSVSNPSTYADASPVGTGPYVLDKFTPQGILFQANPGYWNKSAIHVPEVDFPSYVSNTAAEQALESGQIDWAGNYITNVQNVFVAKDPAHNKVSFNNNPYMASNNVVTLWLNTTRAPLNDPKVRQALGYAADRQQLADQGETGYEMPATSSSGLLLPVDQSLLQSQYANDLPADQRRVEGRVDPDQRRVHQGQRQVEQERQDDQLLGRGSDLVQRLLARHPAADLHSSSWSAPRPTASGT